MIDQSFELSESMERLVRVDSFQFDPDYDADRSDN